MLISVHGAHHVVLLSGKKALIEVFSTDEMSLANCGKVVACCRFLDQRIC